SARQRYWKAYPITATITYLKTSAQRMTSSRSVFPVVTPTVWCWTFENRCIMSYRNNPTAVAALIRPTEVHKDIFIDEELFALEMEHLFANTWVYVGHASQVPNVGDFYTTTVGDQPV